MGLRCAALLDDHARDLAGLGPERQADADLSRALAHDVRHDAVDPDDAEQERDA